MLFWHIIQQKNKLKKLKSDYLKLKKMHIINYDSILCMEENRVLLKVQEKGTGG